MLKLSFNIYGYNIFIGMPPTDNFLTHVISSVVSIVKEITSGLTKILNFCNELQKLVSRFSEICLLKNFVESYKCP